MTLRVLVAEDEPLARLALTEMLGALPDWEVVASVGDGQRALHEGLRLRPDVLVSDVRMPLMDGMQLAEALRGALPELHVVFVTAHEGHAVDAFRVAAVDYLLKPIDPVGLARCVGRVEAAVARRHVAPEPERILVRSVGRIDVVPLDEVIAFRAQRNYVDVITAEGTWTHRETLKSLCDRLDARAFVQVHRSVVVAIRQVRRLVRRASGAEVTLVGGHVYPVGASFVDEVQQRLEQTPP